MKKVLFQFFSLYRKLASFRRQSCVRQVIFQPVTSVISKKSFFGFPLRNWRRSTRVWSSRLWFFTCRWSNIIYFRSSRYVLNFNIPNGIIRTFILIRYIISFRRACCSINKFLTFRYSLLIWITVYNFDNFINCKSANFSVSPGGLWRGGGEGLSSHIVRYFIITLSVSVTKLRIYGWLRIKYTLTLLHRKLKKINTSNK
jgi:hypothetical protein